jgi:hypothetical protein
VSSDEALQWRHVAKYKAVNSGMFMNSEENVYVTDPSPSQISSSTLPEIFLFTRIELAD